MCGLCFCCACLPATYCNWSATFPAQHRCMCDQAARAASSTAAAPPRTVPTVAQPTQPLSCRSPAGTSHTAAAAPAAPSGAAASTCCQPLPPSVAAPVWPPGAPHRSSSCGRGSSTATTGPPPAARRHNRSSAVPSNRSQSPAGPPGAFPASGWEERCGWGYRACSGTASNARPQRPQPSCATRNRRLGAGLRVGQSRMLSKLTGGGQPRFSLGHSGQAFSTHDNQLAPPARTPSGRKPLPRPHLLSEGDVGIHCQQRGPAAALNALHIHGPE